MENLLYLKFKYSEKEYAEAVKWYYSKSLNIKFDMVLSIILVSLGSIFWIMGSKSMLNKILVVLGCFLLLMMLFVLYVNPKRIFRQESKFQDEYKLSFNDQGILFETEHINSNILWSHYSQVKENKEFFYLIYGKYMFTIIPKRTFLNKEDETLFRKLVEEKLDKK
ncbi:MAG: YcxB family protein [Bacillota bacterium]|nr:YcxB family protein [Bacillota bacterium]